MLGQEPPWGWKEASGAHPLQAPGRAPGVPALQGAARGKRAGRSGRVAGAGSGPEGEGATEGGLLRDPLDTKPLIQVLAAPWQGAPPHLSWEATYPAELATTSLPTGTSTHSTRLSSCFTPGSGLEPGHWGQQMPSCPTQGFSLPLCVSAPCQRGDGLPGPQGLHS